MTTDKPVGYIEHPSLAAALAAFQGEMPTVNKSKTAEVSGQTKDGKPFKYSYKFADLADVAKAGHPVLARHGLSFSSKPTLNDGGVFVLSFVLRHDSGEFDEGEFPLPNLAKMQEIGGAITFARRYALGAITGIVTDEDTDAREGNEFETRAPARQAPRSNGSQRNGQSRRGSAPATSEVDQAKAALRGAAGENGWDLQRVADVFATQYGVSLRDATKADDVRAFTAALAADPDHVLGTTTPQETNGKEAAK